METANYQVTLENAATRVGSGVVYRTHPSAPAEDGTITSVNSTYVFVLYAGDRTPKATRPEDLRYLSPVKGTR